MGFRPVGFWGVGGPEYAGLVGHPFRGDEMGQGESHADWGKISNHLICREFPVENLGTET
jgi:hypothetical protein